MGIQPVQEVIPALFNTNPCGEARLLGDLEVRLQKSNLGVLLGVIVIVIIVKLHFQIVVLQGPQVLTPFDIERS